MRERTVHPGLRKILLGLEDDISAGQVTIYIFRRLTGAQFIDFAVVVTWVEAFLIYLLAVGSNVQRSSDILYF